MGRFRRNWVGLFLAVMLVFSVLSVKQVLAAHIETAGNNLSLPVIWAEGKIKDLRGTFGMPVFDGPYTEVDGVKWYHQREDLNYWQADSLIPAEPVNVTWIDWGDNLEAHPWTTNSIVRVETVLYRNIGETPMLGYEMQWLYGEGIDEMWGTNAVEYLSDKATVYSGIARLTIQKLTGTADLVWDAAQGEWVGTGVEGTYYNSAVWEAEGQDGKVLSTIYSGEINIPGKVIYGYNWKVRKTGNGAGTYRITFSLDDINSGTGCHVPCNTFFTEGITQIMMSDNVSGGGVAQIDYVNNLTFIDVEIQPK